LSYKSAISCKLIIYFECLGPQATVQTIRLKFEKLLCAKIVI
jgi:hypothetical protein